MHKGGLIVVSIDYAYCVEFVNILRDISVLVKPLEWREKLLGSPFDLFLQRFEDTDLFVLRNLYIEFYGYWLVSFSVQVISFSIGHTDADIRTVLH